MSLKRSPWVERDFENYSRRVNFLHRAKYLFVAWPGNYLASKNGSIRDLSLMPMPVRCRCIAKPHTKNPRKLALLRVYVCSHPAKNRKITMSIDSVLCLLNRTRQAGRGKYVAHLPACANCLGDDDYDELRIGRYEH